MAPGRECPNKSYRVIIFCLTWASWVGFKSWFDKLPRIRRYRKERGKERKGKREKRGKEREKEEEKERKIE